MKLLMVAGLVGFVTVALGAFGAHGLEGRLTPKEMGWWQTATLYALVHAALAAGWLAAGRGVWPAGLLLAGALVFSGTLYAMALGAPRVLGAVTPVGGVLMLAGWAGIAVEAFRSQA
ncbi:DUF423 domain-containing protein [Parvularcula maris]|uniref:DUF423 domain-containing protein n=1 Tax=Parvularcula maris TaxID=2965077 RepID=A0A9X2L6H2_9PROT|nr:DUF423 domain-containing protein [Parvularcula maris]MCQ8183968.1 DUF423 domain-containing protein [Parvularcula maris]